MLCYYHMTITNLDGFEESTDEAARQLEEMAENIKNPSERRRKKDLIRKNKNDLNLLKLLGKGHKLVDDETWSSVYVVDQFRRGRSDNISTLFREAAQEQPEELVDNSSIFDTDIAIEYELNVPGIWSFTDNNGNHHPEVSSKFITSGGNLKLHQETGPITPEIVTEIYPGIQSATDALLRREEFTEYFLENHDINCLKNKPIRKHSGDHKNYYPGVHIHLDPEEGSDLDVVQDVIAHYSPHLGFLSANSAGTVGDSFYLSERQVKTLGGGYPNGNCEQTEYGTIEIRVPDIQEDRDGWEATLAASIGLAKYAETQMVSPGQDVDVDEALENYYSDLGMNVDLEELSDSLEPEKFNLSSKPKRYLSSGIPSDELQDFLDSVELGLHQTPYSTEHYMGLIQEQLKGQYEKLDQNI